MALCLLCVLASIAAPARLAAAADSDRPPVESGAGSSTDELAQPSFEAGRFSIEVGGIYALAIAWYVQNIEVNKKDWDWPDWDERLLTFDAVRLDNNSFLFNQWYHPLDGGLYYLTGRTNGLGVLGSTLTTVAMSLGWEFFIEFPEMVSLNDLIVTPGAGISIGESYHQLGSWLTSGGAVGDALGRDLVSWTLAPVHTLHAWLDDAPGSAQTFGRDDLGLSREWWHDGVMSIGATTLVGPTGQAHGTPQVAFDTRLRLVRLPRYLRAARAQQWFWAGNLTDLSFRAVTDDAGVEEIALSTRVTLAGYHDQRLRGDRDQIERGHSLVVGLSTAYDVAESQLADLTDRRATLHALGTGVEVYGQATSWLATRLTVEAYFDFAALSTLAWDDWQQAHAEETATSILEEQGYLFSTGGTVRGQLDVELGIVELRGWLSWGRWSMINGLDRFQERVTRDVGGHEEVLEWGLSAGVELTQTPGMLLFTRVDGLSHASELGEIRDDASRVRASLGTGLEF